MSFYWSININKYILKPTKTAIHLWFFCDIVQGTLIIIIWKACRDFLSRHKLAKGNSLFLCSEYERCHHKILVPNTCSIIVLEIPSYTKLVIGDYLYLTSRHIRLCAVQNSIKITFAEHQRQKAATVNRMTPSITYIIRLSVMSEFRLFLIGVWLCWDCAGIQIEIFVDFFDWFVNTLLTTKNTPQATSSF